MFLVKVQYIEYALSQTVMVDLDKMMQLKLKKKINLTTVCIELFVYKMKLHRINTTRPVLVHCAY